MSGFPWPSNAAEWGRAAGGVATVGGILAAGVAVTAAGERLRHSFDPKPSTKRGASSRKQAAPRYNDRKISPRTRAQKLNQHIAQAKSNPLYAPKVAPLLQEKKRALAAAAGTKTRVENGQIKPYAARRLVNGKFATPRGALASRVGSAFKTVAPTAGAIARAAGAVTMIGAAGAVAYNTLQGKHVGKDREEVRARPNDPGRVLVSGLASYAAGGIAGRLVAGTAAYAVGGAALALRTTPIGVGVLAGYGAYNGYAADGFRGAARGAVNMLTFGVGGKAVDKMFGEKPQPSIGGAFVDGVAKRLNDLGRAVDRGMHGRRSSAEPPPHRGGGPVRVTAYSRRDGTRVEGYSRTAKVA